MAKESSETQSPRRAEAKRKAQEAARAAGKDWSQLSKEERKSFRKQARKKGKE
jgi:hypothetical protein